MKSRDQVIVINLKANPWFFAAPRNPGPVTHETHTPCTVSDTAGRQWAPLSLPGDPPYMGPGRPGCRAALTVTKKHWKPPMWPALGELLKLWYRGQSHGEPGWASDDDGEDGDNDEDMVHTCTV